MYYKLGKALNKGLIGAICSVKDDTSAFKVIDATHLSHGFWDLNVEYLDSGSRLTLKGRDRVWVHKFNPPKGDDEEDLFTKDETKGNTMNNANPKTLFEIKNSGDTSYGHYLATNSQGQWVMEVKGSGAILTVSKENVQEVLPYTVGVKYLGSDKVYNYFANKDQFEVGLYLLNGSLVWLSELDTKSKLATKEFKPEFKLATEALSY